MNANKHEFLNRGELSWKQIIRLRSDIGFRGCLSPNLLFEFICVHSRFLSAHL